MAKTYDKQFFNVPVDNKVRIKIMNSSGIFEKILVPISTLNLLILLIHERQTIYSLNIKSKNFSFHFYSKCGEFIQSGISLLYA